MKKEDNNTRYYIDLDLKSRKILNWDYKEVRQHKDKKLK